MLTQPVGELAPPAAAGGEIQHLTLLIVYRGIELSAIRLLVHGVGTMAVAGVTTPAVIEERHGFAGCRDDGGWPGSRLPR